MNPPPSFTTAVLSIRLPTRQSPLRRAFAFATLMFFCFVVSPTARAVTPAPDGGYPNENTAEGEDALFSLTSGGLNTATGAFALYSNSVGFSNTATGNIALYSNTTGGFNTAAGEAALSSNTSGDYNTATGASALANNTTGLRNTANGVSALGSNTTGSDNTVTGTDALGGNTTGSTNTATGRNALYSNTTGTSNTASGFQALQNNTGSFNIAQGSRSGFNLTTGSNNIDFGNLGVAGESNTIRIGNKTAHKATFIAGIYGVAVTGRQVVVNSSGKLGVAASSARFKEAIKPMENTSEALLKLKPVTFRYKEEVDPDGIPQFGLVAEQVEKVNPALVIRDEEGKVMTVRYEAVNAMLLNEFLKEHRKVEEQGAMIVQQQKTFEAKFAQQQKQIEALAATVQRVSEQIQTKKPAPQLVANDE